MSKNNPQVDQFLSESKLWREEMTKLREICLDSNLTEEMKWELPCYSYNGGNVVVIQGFKKYCALLFLKGVLMKDPDGVLQKTGANTHVGRQIRFTNLKEIIDMKPVIKKAIQEAIEVEKSGAKIERKKNSELEIPEELQDMLEEMPNLREAWERLTPGRQRGYIFFFSGAKQSETRIARIEKNIDKILDGIGLNDRY